jgi:hypothetical protein
MLKMLVTLGLGAAILLAAVAFVASGLGGLDHDSIVSGSTMQTEMVQPGTVLATYKGSARLVP